MIREKNNNKRPVMIAPTTLVAANSIARSTTDIKIVPSIPIRRTGRTAHIQSLIPNPSANDKVISTTARYETAIPNTTHKNAGVTVIVAVIVKNAVIIPIIMLATIASPVQLLL